MLFIVGGATRSGKTLLARRFLDKARVPWFPLDALRVGLSKGLPASAFDLENEDLEEARCLWPVVERILDSILFYDLPHLVEGSCLRPSDVAGLVRRRADKRVVVLFLGYPTIAPQKKLAELDEHPVGGNDWLATLSVQEKLAHVQRGIQDSETLRAEALAAGLRFFDTGSEFEVAHDAALDFLCGALGAPEHARAPA